MPNSLTTAGGLLLCHAEPAAVRPAAHLLRERLLLAPAGAHWSLLAPEGTPWGAGSDSVEDVLTGWTTAVAVGTGRPVLGLWWDTERTGFAVAAGLRRPLSYGWAADGTPSGDPDVMRSLGARFGLDPVLDVAALEDLTRADPAADGRARLLGLLAVLSRAGLDLPAGVAPGRPGAGLRAAVRGVPGGGSVEWPGWRQAVRRGPRALGTAQLAVGVPLLLWAAAHRSPGWTAAGLALTANGTLTLTRP
ncbi:hypothetical protein [Streptomyces sp. NPDC089919]|uniref:hypothetical protein n=1 Tax=Streptomyces sp. NPDC089919 TaxID=3155188 RepID=UPI00343D279D